MTDFEVSDELPPKVELLATEKQISLIQELQTERGLAVTDTELLETVNRFTAAKWIDKMFYNRSSNPPAVYFGFRALEQLGLSKREQHLVVYGDAERWREYDRAEAFVFADPQDGNPPPPMLVFDESLNKLIE